MPEPIDLQYAFGLAPKKAVEYFEGKGYAFSWDWYDTFQEANNKKFHVAKVMQMDLLQDIRNSVRKITAEGITARDFRRELEPKLKARGWWGRKKVIGPDGKESEVQLGNAWRIRTIFVNNEITSIAAGRWKAFEANAAARPYLQFVCVLDASTRPSHRVLHGKVFHISDPIWKRLAPPLGWGCRCHLRALSADDVKRLGLKVSDSKDCLSTEDRLVSETTGELQPVAVYTDPKTGKRVANEPGWDYNPGLSDREPNLAKYDKPIVEQYKAAMREQGLVHRFPVKKTADVANVVKQFDQENPGNFQQGFKEMVFKKQGNAMMAARQDGTLTISTETFGGGLNPARDLRTAMVKIGIGEDLSFNEEYCIEALWHEIGHCRSKGWAPRDGRPTFVTQAMETLNQWTARHTYPEFLAKLGGKPAHQEAILANGPGYRSWIRNFRTILRLADIEEGAALGVLRPLSVETDWYALPKEIPKQLAGLMATPELAAKITKAMIYLDERDGDRFEAIAKQILGEP